MKHTLIILNICVAMMSLSALSQPTEDGYCLAAPENGKIAKRILSIPTTVTDVQVEDRAHGCLLSVLGVGSFVEITQTNIEVTLKRGTPTWQIPADFPLALVHQIVLGMTGLLLDKNEALSTIEQYGYDAQGCQWNRTIRVHMNAHAIVEAIRGAYPDMCSELKEGGGHLAEFAAPKVINLVPAAPSIVPETSTVENTSSQPLARVNNPASKFFGTQLSGTRTDDHPVKQWYRR